MTRRKATAEWQASHDPPPIRSYRLWNRNGGGDCSDLLHCGVVMRGKDQWIVRHEQILEDYASEVIDRDTAVAELSVMGFTREEIETQLKEIEA